MNQFLHMVEFVCVMTYNEKESIDRTFLISGIAGFFTKYR